MKQKLFEKYYINNKPIEISQDIIDKITPLTKCRINEFINIENISKEQAIEDIEIFFDIIKYCYCGYEYYNDKIDFCNLKQNVINSISDITSTAEIGDCLYEILSEYINDSHFSFIGENHLSFQKLYRAYFTDVILDNINDKYIVSVENDIINIGHEFLYEQIKDNIFKTLPKIDGTRRYLLGIYTQNPVNEIIIDSYTFPVHLCKTDDYSISNESVVTKEIYNIPIVHHSTYSNDKINLSFDEYKTSGEKYKNSKYIIWSLLSNGGGNSNFPENFILGINDNAIWKFDMACIESPFINKDSGGKKSYHIYNSPDIDLNKSEYNGKMYVLQNKGVASSGESAVLYARTIKNVCFVGSGTMGCGQFGETFTYKLPNSNLHFRMGCKVFNMEGFEEGVGLLPDYWIDSDDPIQYLAEYINVNC